MRPGRLDQLVYIPLPDKANREAILQASLRRTNYSSEINLKQVAEVTEGFSAADLSEICQKACKLAIHDRIQNRKAYDARKEAETNQGNVVVRTLSPGFRNPLKIIFRPKMITSKLLPK